MIVYLKRHQLNIEKYDACIHNAVNSRIYAFSWYLDIVADHWDALVLNDYEAVMPLPWRQKYFIKYIYPPAWTQQLGVFSGNEISESLILEFIKAIPKKFKKVTIQFNSGNIFKHKNNSERVNYILPLNKPYEEIYKGFNANRKRDLKKGLKKNYSIDKNITPKEFLDFYLNEPKSYNVDNKQINTIKKLVNSKNEASQIWGIRNDHKLEASILFLIGKNRITNLLPITSNFGKEKSLTTLLINEMFEINQNSTKIFDFEGSMIKGVAGFYRSFGVKFENYILFDMIIFY
jgi:hypothetical protein